MTFAVVELTEQTWPRLVELFGPNGAVAGCWCTWFWQRPNQLRDNGSEVNREILHDRVTDREPVGLLALAGDRAVGWTAVAPRASYARLASATVAQPAPADLAGVWSVTCFFVHRTARRQGVTGTLLAGAVDYARRHGARAVEGYPVDTEQGRRPSGELYHGTVGMFRRAGFQVVQQHGPRRALMRKDLN